MFRLQLGALALAAALAAPLAASAQTAPVPGPDAAAPAPGAAAPMQRHHHHRHGGLARAMRGLNLSPDQKTKIAAILKSARDARRTAGTAPDPQTRKANMLALRQQIDGVLTDTQRAQLSANLKANRHMHQDGQSPRPPQAPAQ